VGLMLFGKEFLCSSGARTCIKSNSPLPQSFDLLHKIGIYVQSIDCSSHWSYQHILIVTDAFCKINGMLNLILQVKKTLRRVRTWNHERRVWKISIWCPTKDKGPEQV